ncbi:hypothetical protein GCM10010168_49120 [Actinoplanes ianthinogenes]|uniref:Nephrocystin 3-like N-terminal domain-containing protein n=1 Tax=Actinoplanes ianthinogenes TaxID=122358 RepID=A0ABM7M334_9ACTN|nr:hypothetical protein [Actinoplanes ianthinogenes]BCJ45964.1 hypothetical protein Aiant_66210 [Actinoplanes ianthinogenes]GGR25425.1 hypothetical protein GCM10010168_49120 [Actinoplanes ianthinogenes]
MSGRSERGGTAIGQVNGPVTIHQHAGRRARARSAYTRRIEQSVLPPELRDRDAELAELAAFCLAERDPRYAWWQAGPWAGKSALLSTFVLRPPAELAGRVRLVSFFVTARLAAQDTRDAFTTELVEQLCALLDEDLPVVVDEAGRESALLDLLARAASECARDGGRLVLVVDGLDEDRGVTTGPHAHSIAALLPSRPPAGMRVIVAGRPHPPIPDDVPQWHPLRDPGIVRPLGDSPHASSIQRESESELVRLLAGNRLERDLLGLVTAARGGLSAADLRELTEAELVEIKAVLHTVTGRTFRGQVAPGSAVSVYLLGHEELYQAAVDQLGPRQLAGFRGRLHDWAESYRSAGWPAQTPEYLLAGYSRMLAAAGAADRLTRLVVDTARHDRMLELTGGDTAALAELVGCQDLRSTQDTIDLYAMVLLAYRRRRLETRNAWIPVRLPAVWERIGNPARAEALARSITQPDRRAMALAQIARAATASGDHRRATAMFADAVAVAWQIADDSRQGRTVRDLARHAVEDGDGDTALRLGRQLGNRHWRSEALKAVAEALLEAGALEQAHEVAAGISAVDRIVVLTALARAAVAAGEPHRARAAVRQVDDLLRDTPLGCELRAALVARFCEVVAAVGEHQRAHRMALGVTEPHWRDRALVDLAGALAGAGEHGRADEISDAVENPVRRVEALTAMVLATDAGAHQQRTRSLIERAERVARSTTDPAQRPEAQARLCRLMVATGQLGPAERLARSIAGRGYQIAMLGDLAVAAARAGDHVTAERIARELTDPLVEGRVTADVAVVLAGNGDHERAYRLARGIGDPERRAETLTELAHTLVSGGTAPRVHTPIAGSERNTPVGGDVPQVRTLPAGAQRKTPADGDLTHVRTLPAGAQRKTPADGDLTHVRTLPVGAQREAPVGGDLTRVRTLIAGAGRSARTVTDGEAQPAALIDLARAVDAAGDHRRGRRIARLITEPKHRVRALTELARAATGAGRRWRVRLLIREARGLVRHATQSVERTIALAHVAAAMARTGNHRRAYRLVAEPMAGWPWRDLVLVEVALARARTGDRWGAASVVREMDDLAGQPGAMARAAAALAAAGRPRDARALLGEAETAAEYLNFDGSRAEALAAVARAAVALGDRPRARALSSEAEAAAHLVGDPDLKARALVEVAGAAAAVDDRDRARRLAQGIVVADRRAEALCELAATAEPAEARRLLAEALVSGRWSAPLPVLGRVAPEVVLRFAEVVLHEVTLQEDEPR